MNNNTQNIPCCIDAVPSLPVVTDKPSMQQGLVIMEDQEIWKDIPGYEELYQVSSIGRLKSIKSDKILNPRVNQSGYYHTALYNNGKKKWLTIHRMVAMTFIDNPENKPMINHKDSNRLNNRVENLEWCTHGENMKHGFLYGNKTQKGEKNNQAKITREIVEQVRAKYAEGNLTQWQVGELFGLRRCHVKDITTHKIWK